MYSISTDPRSVSSLYLCIQFQDVLGKVHGDAWAPECAWSGRYLGYRRRMACDWTVLLRVGHVVAGKSDHPHRHQQHFTLLPKSSIHQHSPSQELHHFIDCTIRNTPLQSWRSKHRNQDGARPSSASQLDCCSRSSLSHNPPPPVLKILLPPSLFHHKYL